MSSTYIIKDAYKDPFEDNGDMTHYEIVKILEITNYTKRSRSIPNVDVVFCFIEFDVDMQTLTKNNLSLQKYMELLSTKDQSIKDKYKYKEGPEIKKSLNYGFNEKVNPESRLNFLLKIIEILKLAPSNELMSFITANIRVSDEDDSETSKFIFGSDPDEIIKNPYKKGD